MMIIAMFFVGSGLVLNVADLIPNYDVKRTCRTAVELSGVQGRTVGAASMARWQRVKIWKKIGQSIQARNGISVLRPWLEIDRRAMSSF